MKGKISPMMAHYLELKQQYPDTVILYRLGDFYEMFFDDAVECSNILNITLTGRDCGLSSKAPMCGVPFHSVDTYIKRLVEKGKKVAICEQLSAPTKGKIVERDVVRIITQGTLIEENQLDAEKNNYIASVGVFKDGIGLAWADVSTGELNTIEYSSEQVARLEDMLNIISPSEIICNEEAFRTGENLESRKTKRLVKFDKYFDWAFNYSSALKKLLKQFEVATLKSFECDNKRFAISTSGALLEYLHETQKNTLKHFDRIKYINSEDYIILDKNTRRNLEITETIRERKSEGSLLWVLDKTRTHMGARYLRKCINQPLRNPDFINQRLEAVGELVDDYDSRLNLENSFTGFRDIERLVSKISYGTISPTECYGLRNTLEKLPEIKKIISDLKSDLFKEFNKYLVTFDDLTFFLKRVLNEKFESKEENNKGFIRKGYNSELDRLKEISKNSKKSIALMEDIEKEKSGIKNLKIKYNKVFGYFIEIPKQFEKLVPLNYIRRQTISGSERYITEELKQFESEVLDANEKIERLEIEIFEEVKNKLLSNISDLKVVSGVIAAIDVILSFATISAKNNYVKPVIIERGELEIKNGRHPVIEKIIGLNEFVSNDCVLGGEVVTQIISGPNMGGKSTFMRQIALIVFMGHLGCFVPADFAKIPITDRIFTRVGASDDVASGISTFMMEMIEVATILNYATENSLVILDEIGRGTSTYDGLSIAWSVCEYISTKIKSKTLFATHYHELAELEGRINGIKNFKVLVKEINGDIVFLHKITEGSANKSFGIEVASFAGLPKSVVDRAKEVAKSLENSELNVGKKLETKNSDFEEVTIKEINKNYTKIIETISKINVNNCSPMQALGILENLVNLYKD